MEFITGNKIKSICNFSCDEHGFNKLNDVKINEIPKFFVKTDLIDLFVKNHLPNEPFILITHNSDFPIESNWFFLLENKNLVSWYSQNVNFEHPKLFSIPIGIANEIWPHGNIEILNNVINQNNPKKNIIYANFDVMTNYDERNYCLNQIKNKGIELESKKNFSEYLKELSESFFCISPNGNGIDCHKTWESLYLKTIPIVTKSININFYKDLPMVIINDWSEFDPYIFSESFYEKIWNNFDINKINLNHFIK